MISLMYGFNRFDGFYSRISISIKSNPSFTPRRAVSSPAFTFLFSGETAGPQCSWSSLQVPRSTVHPPGVLLSSRNHFFIPFSAEDFEVAIGD